MPVPSAPQVSLGEAEAFGERGRLTAPRIEYRDSWRPTFSPSTSSEPSTSAAATISTISNSSAARAARPDSTKSSRSVRPFRPLYQRKVISPLGSPGDTPYRRRSAGSIPFHGQVSAQTESNTMSQPKEDPMSYPSKVNRVLFFGAATMIGATGFLVRPNGRKGRPRMRPVRLCRQLLTPPGQRLRGRLQRKGHISLGTGRRRR